MNKWKIFAFSLLIWSLSLAFLGFPPFVALFMGFIPALTHSALFTLWIKQDESFNKMLLKSFVLFVVLGLPMSIEPLLLVGMLFSFLSILVSVIGLPFYVYKWGKT